MELLYEPPHIPNLLSLSTYLYLISFTSSLFASLINASLIGPLLIGIFLANPSLAELISTSTQQTFIEIGYIGLILLVFEAGLTTDIALLARNLPLSTFAALTGILLPIAFSMALLGTSGGFGYTKIQAFAAGAALCSTSLSTTLALLTPELRQTRVGSVLMSAALLDDVVGLVIAGIISNLASSSSSGIAWQTIVRPVLVSVAFALFTPLLACVLRKSVLWLHVHVANIKFNRILQTSMSDPRIQLFHIIVTLSGFVAGAKYAGTSELFGSYLAGAFMAHIFDALPQTQNEEDVQSTHEGAPHPSPVLHAYETYLAPILTTLLAPIFFASIGSALPVGTMFTVDGKHDVVWKGLVYSLLMVLAKMGVGLWMLIWPNPEEHSKKGVWRGLRTLRKWKGKNSQADPQLPLDSKQVDQRLEPSTTMKNNAENATPSRSPSTSPPPLTLAQSAALLAFAMVPRGEIALIVAQLARPILVGDNMEEPFAVVIWAILVSTFGGAICVGILLRR